MKKSTAILLSLLMAFTIFFIPEDTYAVTASNKPAQQVIDMAISQVGYLKGDGTDKYTACARSLGHSATAGWCGRFVWWCFYKTGNKVAYYNGNFTGNPTKIKNWGEKAGLLISASNAQPGDIFVNLPKGKTHHTGLIEYVDSSGIHTIERNHSIGKDGVRRLTRKSVQYVIRPKYEKCSSYKEKTQSTTSNLTSASVGTSGYKVVTTTKVYYRTGPGTSYAKKGVYGTGTELTIVSTSNGWGKTSSGYYVCLKYTSEATESSSFQGTVTTNLYYRTGPGTGYSKAGMYNKGTVITIVSSGDGWGKTSSGYYVSLEHVSKSVGTSSYKAVVSTDLNCRTGPGTNYSKAGMYKKGTVITIISVSNGWARIGSGKYVMEKYLRKQ